jgi:uncharacterized surface protein with fasciclin (FAS1) repeats
MRLTRAAACRSLVGCLIALTLTVPALAGPRPATVLDLAAQQKNLSTFVAAVHTAGLDDMLRGAGPFTVYAPTNDAFDRLPAAQRDALLSDPVRLKAMLMGLVVNDKVLVHQGDATMTGGAVQTVGGAQVAFGGDEQRPTFGGARIVAADLQAGNGYVTTIDKVLMP